MSVLGRTCFGGDGNDGMWCNGSVGFHGMDELGESIVDGLGMALR